MKKQYSSSLYSQKSTTSAKSGRSFLSLSTSIWPSSKKKNLSPKEEDDKSNVWQNVKRLLIGTKAGMRKDNDSIATRSINTTSSSTSSISKLKHLLFLSPNQQLFQAQPDKAKSNNTATPPPSYHATLNGVDIPIDHFPPEKSTISQSKGPAGILINKGEDSAEAIEERKRRRHKRREYILKLQQQNHGFCRHFYPSSDSRIDPAIDYHQQHHIRFEEEQTHPESSSSDTLITNKSTEGEEDYIKEAQVKPRVGFYNDDDDDKWEFNPRIMFIEPSPVPRFRNVAPPPPPSPPYMNILVDNDELVDSRKSEYLSVIKSPNFDDEPPIVLASKDILTGNKTNSSFDEDDRRMTLLVASLRPQPLKKPHLYFHSPYQRGQTIKFSLQNAIPEDNIILFKFLTSNTREQQPERYFVRPSAGQIMDQTDIMLFLNQVPTQPLILRDKILIRWAVIQKNTRIEQWVKSLGEVSRKKWINMLEEQFPDHVTIQMTKIKIHFV